MKFSNKYLSVILKIKMFKYHFYKQISFWNLLDSELVNVFFMNSNLYTVPCIITSVD